MVSRLQISQTAREQLERLMERRTPVEREITIAAAGAPRHYALRMSVVTEAAGGQPLGIVASLSDITRHRELQRTQRDVMALVTHELKTPLTAIQGMSELLAQFDPDATERRTMHLTINEEAKRLARMIEEYLDLTRLESGAQPPRILPFRIEQVVERSLLLLDPIAKMKGIGIDRKIAADLPAMPGDAELIARAFTNLVDNAIKFSPAGSAITIAVEADDASIRIEVADQGVGIAPEFLPRVFEKFYRVPRSGNTVVAGTGLGLAMVREIAELHGGRVRLESEPGAGSVFTLILPLRSSRKE